MRLVAAFLTWIIVTGAQEAGTTTFRTSTQLVVETVTVKDKNGKFVNGLTAKDFTVTEDGAPQPIRFFEVQKLPDAPSPAAPPASSGVRLYDKIPRTQISPETPVTRAIKATGCWRCTST